MFSSKLQLSLGLLRHYCLFRLAFFIHEVAAAHNLLVIANCYYVCNAHLPMALEICALVLFLSKKLVKVQFNKCSKVLYVWVIPLYYKKVWRARDTAIVHLKKKKEEVIHI
jgi:hypothetical protein